MVPVPLLGFLDWVLTSIGMAYKVILGLQELDWATDPKELARRLSAMWWSIGSKKKPVDLKSS